MFRPAPKATLFQTIPYQLITPVLLILALVVSVILLFSLEREKLLLQDFVEGKRIPMELFPDLWQHQSDLIIVTILVFLVSAIGIVAIITFLHYQSTRRALEEVKGLARNILKNIPTGVLTLNRAGVITAVNPMAEAVLKRSGEELLAHSYESIFAEGETIRGALDKALHSHEYLSREDVPYRANDEMLHTIRIGTAELTGDDGQSAGVILQAQDVTAWLDLERRVLVSEKLAAIHTLSAGVAHELRNPLSAMDLNLHLLEDALKEQCGPAQNVARYLQIVNAECRRLSSVLDKFMRFAKHMAMGLREVDVRKVIAHIVALMQFDAHARKIHLEERVGDGLPPILGDETQISQALMNILVNAFQAMPDGGRCSIIARVRRNADGCWIEIAVSDTGVGIKEEDLSRLFEPFYTTRAGGTGLGLAIAYRIMQDHGGAIRVARMPGSGTTMVMQFPVEPSRVRSLV
jgi:signal transduction histidine kinase